MVTQRSKNIASTSIAKWPSRRKLKKKQTSHKCRWWTKRTGSFFFQLQMGRPWIPFLKNGRVRPLFTVLVTRPLWKVTAQVFAKNKGGKTKFGRVHLTFKNARTKTHSSHPSWGKCGHIHICPLFKIKTCFEFRLFSKTSQNITRK